MLTIQRIIFWLWFLMMQCIVFWYVCRCCEYVHPCVRYLFLFLLIKFDISFSLNASINQPQFIADTTSKQILIKSLIASVQSFRDLNKVNLNCKAITGSEPQQKTHHFLSFALTQWWVAQTRSLHIFKVRHELVQWLGLVLDQTKRLDQDLKTKGQNFSIWRRPAHCVR